MKGPNDILPVVVAVRLTEDETSKLDQLARETKRTRSNMIRLIIDQEYERTFKSKSSTYAQPTSQAE
jgi:predicted transcriptional regulator